MRTVKPETITRTLILLIALLNQIFAIFGIPQLSVADDRLDELVEGHIAVVANLLHVTFPFTRIYNMSNIANESAKVHIILEETYWM